MLKFKHPFADSDPGYDRTSPIFVGDYVTLDAGTGIVHSAPAYGLDDFISCKAHGMSDDEILKPVLGDGKYASWLPFFGGLTIWKARSRSAPSWKKSARCSSCVMFDHSYMHCWRHKTPIIYRATSQWFVGMDVTPKDGGKSLRETALAAHRATPLSFPPGARRACTA